MTSARPPGPRFTGKVAVIYPQLTKETRTARVRIEIANPDGALLPDMYADVEIATGAGEPVVAVPDDAVIDTRHAPGRARSTRARAASSRARSSSARRGDGYVEIRDGVADGDRSSSSANFLIDAESNLKAALQGLRRRPGRRGGAP